MMRLWTISRLSHRALFDWGTPGEFVLNVLLRPVVAVVALGLLSDHITDGQLTARVVIGSAAAGLTWVTLGGVAQSVFRERDFGTLPLTLGAPTPPALVVSLRMLPHIPVGVASILATTLAGCFSLGLPFTNIQAGGFVLAAAATTLSLAALGLVLATIALTLRDMWGPVTMTGSFISAFGGGMVPPELLPDGIRRWSSLLPGHHGIEAMRASFVGGANHGLAEDIMIELARAAAVFVIALLLFTWFERIARRNGTLDLV